MKTAYLGLGSNLGDRIGFLRHAIALMRPLGVVRAYSQVYETAPVGYAEQGDFLNAAIALETDLPPEQLLPALKSIEKELGRQPGPRYGPREIDLDILVMDGVVRKSDPVIPHPEMHRRGFVLRPLADIAPDLFVPGHGAVRDLLEALPADGTKISPHVLDGV
jgi:2-amino-4-hydroxy-6-hydroxymethyldihydropteridine diphosphokinase